ncbi:MAG TPA: right-handed parallel beta-helix repeat-containing protein, partial [Allocoleopsis sp.]
YIQGIFNYRSSDYAHKNVVIKHVFAYDNSGKNGPQIPNTGSGIIISDVDGGLIERCVAYHNGWLCNSLQGGPVGIWAWDSNNITIQYNESYNNKTNGKKDGGGFDLDGGMKNSVMQYNYSHDNDGHGYLLAQFPYARKSYNNVVRFNISQNDGRKNRTGGIYFWGDFRNTEVYNNTVYMDAPPSVDSIKPTPLGFELNDIAPFFQSQLPSEIKIMNNIFIAAPELNIVQVFDDIEDLVLKNNNYFKTDSTFSVLWKGKIFKSIDEWRKATNQEVEGANIFGFNLNPQCRKMGKGQTINNADSLNALTAYDLLPNSPLINKGLNIADFLKIKNPAFDYTGKKVPIDGKFDLGAIEFDVNLN